MCMKWHIILMYYCFCLLSVVRTNDLMTRCLILIVKDLILCFFMCLQEAERAIQCLNGKLALSKKLVVRWAHAQVRVSVRLLFHFTTFKIAHTLMAQWINTYKVEPELEVGRYEPFIDVSASALSENFPFTQKSMQKRFQFTFESYIKRFMFFK